MKKMCVWNRIILIRIFLHVVQVVVMLWNLANFGQRVSEMFGLVKCIIMVLMKHFVVSKKWPPSVQINEVLD